MPHNGANFVGLDKSASTYLQIPVMSYHEGMKLTIKLPIGNICMTIF